MLKGVDAGIMGVAPCELYPVVTHGTHAPQLKTCVSVLIPLSRHHDPPQQVRFPPAMGAGTGLSQHFQGQHRLMAVIPVDGQEIAEQLIGSWCGYFRHPSS